MHAAALVAGALFFFCHAIELEDRICPGGLSGATVKAWRNIESNPDTP